MTGEPAPKMCAKCGTAQAGVGRILRGPCREEIETAQRDPYPETPPAG